jgi:hypothetical protein
LPGVTPSEINISDDLLWSAITRIRTSAALSAP